MNKFLLFALTFIFSFQLSAQSDKYVKMMEKQVLFFDCEACENKKHLTLKITGN